MKVYQAINKVQAALSVEGIAKERKNEQQGWKFRGVDDIYNALAPLLAKHGLCILPRATSREIVERVTVKEYQGNKKESALFYVCVHVEFDFVCAEDGSRHTVTTYGEAMDSGDKATNKAMSAAYKYACMQAFSIPTEGDNDADSTTHEVKPKKDERILPVKEAAKLTPIAPEQQKAVERIGADMVAAWQDGQELAVIKAWRSVTDNDERIHLWSWLSGESKLRAFLNANRTN